MTKKICYLSVAVFTVAIITNAVLAQGPPPGTPGQGPPDEVVERLLERGWKQVVPEVFQRPVEDNSSYETLAFGSDGLLWLLRVLEAQLQALESHRTGELNPDLEAVIEGHIAMMDQTAALMLEERRNGSGRKSLGTKWDLDDLLTKLGEAGTKAAVACDTSLHRDANAYASATGPQATSNASFSETCSAFYADPFCNAYAEGWTGTTFTFNGQTTDPPGGYNSASCSASAGVSATSSCYSIGETQVSLQDSAFGLVSHYIVKTNNTCRPPAVSIIGPSSVWVPAYSCTTKTWTSSVSGGTPPYVSYQWKYNGIVVGSGTSYSRTYCNNFPTINDRTYFDSVSLTVTDSAADTGTATKGVSVTYEGSSCEPCICQEFLITEKSVTKIIPCPQ